MTHRKIVLLSIMLSIIPATLFAHLGVPRIMRPLTHRLALPSLFQVCYFVPVLYFSLYELSNHENNYGAYALGLISFLAISRAILRVYEINNPKTD